MTRIAKAVLFCCIASSWPLAAQAPVPDTSGNGMLNGTYYFRQAVNVISFSPDSTGIVGDISDAIVVYGSIAFDGNGHYVISNGLAADAGVGAPIPLSCYIANTNCTSGVAVSGTYAIAASGAGSISSPLGSVVAGDVINGLVGANGVFIGSATETTYGYGDLFIAAPLGTPQPTNATFNGSYTVTGFFPGIGNAAASADAFFQLNADGNGNLGTVNVTGYYGGGGTSTISQSNSNIKYFFSNGAAVVTFPTSSTANFFSGQEYLYFSPDGSFFFGGSPSSGAAGTYGYDMIIGVRNGSGSQSMQGNYYQAGIDQNVAEAASTGYVDFDSYYGALSTQSNGNILGHQRLNDLIFTDSVYDFTYSDSFTPAVSSYTDQGADSVYPGQYAVGAGGAVRIGEGTGPYLGINVAVQAPSFSQSQPVYIDPTGIVNAASFAPFTAGISNGEFVTIFGTNLAAGTAEATTVPFPTTLGNVQVLINQVPAPIFFVSSGQVSAIVPSQNPYQLATIQVINNNVPSNVVTMRVAPTTPGLYSNPSGGVYAAVYDANTNQIVTPSTPANPGDTVEVFGTGFGVVSPAVQDGYAAPTNGVLSYTYNTMAADVDGVTATASPAVLAPGLVGLYQINVTIPTSTPAGDHYLDISGSDPSTMAVESYTQQVLISIGSGALDVPATPPAPMAHGAHARTRQSKPAHNRPVPCFMGTKRACAAENQ